MKLTRPRPRLWAVAAIAAGAVMALALPPGAAVSVASQSPPVQAAQFADKATLDAKGAVVFATVQVVCPPPAYHFYHYLSASITEAVGGGLSASGTTDTDRWVCDGTVQQVRVVVVPTQRAFKKGPAVGQATLMVCTGQIPTCQPDLVDRRAIQIVKP